jgi:RNA polymerase primary sigma factor
MEAKPTENVDDLRKSLSRILKKLSWREREIVKLRYGLGDGYTYTLEDVAHIFKVTRERIRHIEKKALVRLKNNSDMQDLMQDLFPD